jgi:hypothetical protein
VNLVMRDSDDMDHVLSVASVLNSFIIHFQFTEAKH